MDDIDEIEELKDVLEDQRRQIDDLEERLDDAITRNEELAEVLDKIRRLADI